MKKIKYLILIVLGFVVFDPVQASETEWQMRDDLRARLIAGSIQESVLNAGLEVKLSEGWHTYWRVPGDSGLPPRFDWSGSENVESVEVSWPAPQRFEEFSLQVFGYKNEVLFPLDVMLSEPTKPAKLSLNLDIMICKDICIPENMKLSLDIPADNGAGHDKQIKLVRERYVPVSGDTGLLKLNTVVLGPDAIVINAFSKKGFAQANVFPVIEADGYAFSAVPDFTIDEAESLDGMIKIAKPGDVESLTKFLEGKELNVIFVSGRDAIEKSFSF